MTTSAIRTRGSLCVLLATTCLAAAAQAQNGPKAPPQRDSQSPTGVSYKTGSFSHAERDLAIGGGAFPSGLTLERSYSSSLDGGNSVYAGLKTQGWTTNLAAGFSNAVVPNEFGFTPEGQEVYRYSITIGTRSVGFGGGSSYPTGGFVGSYYPEFPGGEALVFTGDHSTGYYTFTDADGTVLVFNPLSPSGPGVMRVARWTAPDGTRLDFSYGNYGPTAVFSNRGYAILFEYGSVPGGTAITRACAVNLANQYVTPGSACPAGVQAVTYSYAAGATGPMLTGVTNALGQTTSYGYTSREHLGCITLPGQSGCQISNSYGTCVRDPALLYDPEGMTLHEPVRYQTTATGETYSYSFPSSQQCPPAQTGTQTSMTVSGSATTTVTLNNSAVPTAVSDPLGRTTAMAYAGFSELDPLADPAQITSITAPEGNIARYGYDGRANVTEQRLQAKGGSGLADLVSAAGYPSGCANPKTCNKPDYVIDANGNRTDYTYSADHGGVLTETGPAVNGVRPQKRFTYAQRYAWIRNSWGGYSPAASPVWLLVREASCRTQASCSGGSDEVVTTYDYGPDSGPNTLLLRGKVADAAGLSLRTCYGYDANGNKISETSPRAGLASCQ